MAPFVGRQPEVAALRARLAQSLAGEPQVVLVAGPPGIGKTALVERFLASVEQPLVVLRGGGEAIPTCERVHQVRFGAAVNTDQSVHPMVVRGVLHAR